MTNSQKIARNDLEELLERGFQYAIALTHDETQAEDLVQEACIRMVRNSSPWKRAYFFTVIRNYFIELYRHRKKFPSVPFEEQDNKKISDEQELRNTEEITANTELLEKTLSTLTPEEREILFLFTVEEYTAQEIGELINRPRNSVLSIVYRSRMKVRKILKQKHGEVSP